MNILKVFTKQRQLADIGESAAAGFLKKHGYKIIEKNYTADDGEIDIIARNREYTVFAEVKTRTYPPGGTSWESRPAASVNYEKQSKIIRVAKCYLAYNKNKGRVRFDIIEVYADNDGKINKINHIENAFRQERRFQ